MTTLIQFFYFTFFCIPVISLAQPTGNDAIYLNIFDVNNNDTIFIGRSWNPNTLTKNTKIEDGNYTITDRGEDGYGFYKYNSDDYLHKVIFETKTYTIEIVKNKKETMRITFVDFYLTNYFINIPFQKGDFVFSTPDKNLNTILPAFFSFHRKAHKNYGFDITPINWNSFKVSKAAPYDAKIYSIYKFNNNKLPHQTTYQGYINSTKQKDTFKTYVVIDERRVKMHLESTDGEKVAAFYGRVDDAGDSTFVFHFEYGYQLAVSAKIDRVPNAFINTDTSSGPLIKGLTIISNKGKIQQIDTIAPFITTENENFAIDIPSINIEEQKSLAIKLNFKEIENATPFISKKNPTDYFVFFLFDVEKHPWIHNQVLKVKLNRTLLTNIELPNTWLHWMGKFQLSAKEGL